MHPKKHWLTGFNCIKNALQAQKRTHECLFYAQDPEDSMQRTLLKACHSLDIPTKNLYSSQKLYKKAHQPDEYLQAKAALLTSPLPILNANKLLEQDQSFQGLWLALNQPQNPQNLGALLRTAYFLKVDGVIVTQKSTAPLNQATSRASAGALEVVPLWTVTGSLRAFLSELSSLKGAHLIGSCPNAPNMANCLECSSNQATVLVVGNEHAGLPRERWNEIVHEWIGIEGGDSFVDSLNVSVATALLLQQLKRAGREGARNALTLQALSDNQKVDK
jgi:tRNA G18 (ribose-2'-O)-methylase SpoU